MLKLNYILLFLLICQSMIAQKDISELRWRQVVSSQPDEWYGSEEAIRIAANVLLYQRNVGGWPKNTPMHQVLSKKEIEKLQKLQSEAVGATTDNNATVMEMVYLSKVYGKTGIESYKLAFLKGVNYLLEAQYDNGGWPQCFPLKDDYSRRITYNDGSMVNIMKVMDKIGSRSDFYSITVDEPTALKAKQALEKGIEIILKSQYLQNGVLTVWCAQHDEISLEPAQARSYELPSLSGGESAGITLLLMDIENPSMEVVNAIESAVNWFEESKIEGIKTEWYLGENGERDRKVVADENAPPLWARFYGLSDNRPFFCDRDGIKKYSLAEIGIERRTGYSWYIRNPQAVLDAYDEWQARWAREEIIATPAEEQRFKELSTSAGEILFQDDCTGDWRIKWHLDGKVGKVKNTSSGMDFTAGPEINNDAHHAVLWSRETFSGDLMIEYDYTRLDARDGQVNIIYIEATGWEEGPYSKDIFEWNELREVPSMSSYFNNMNTLHISYAALSEEGDYVRARRYRPDLGTRLSGTDLGAAYNTGFFNTGVNHHISIIKKGYELYMKVENSEQTMLYKWNYLDHPIITEGRIGLRHMYSRSAQYSNFKVRQIK